MRRLSLGYGSFMADTSVGGSSSVDDNRELDRDRRPHQDVSGCDCCDCDCRTCCCSGGSRLRPRNAASARRGCDCRSSPLCVLLLILACELEREPSARNAPKARRDADRRGGRCELESSDAVTERLLLL